MIKNRTRENERHENAAIRQEGTLDEEDVVHEGIGPDHPEAAKLLRISRGSAYLAAKAGSLPVVRVGGSLRVPRGKLEVMLGLSPDPEAR